MPKLAVIGDKHSVLPFKALGLEVFVPKYENDARKIIHHLAEQGFAVIFVTEEIALENQETIVRFSKELTPTIIPIPSHQGSFGLGMERVHKNVEKAAGRSLFGEEG